MFSSTILESKKYLTIGRKRSPITGFNCRSGAIHCWEIEVMLGARLCSVASNILLSDCKPCSIKLSIVDWLRRGFVAMEYGLTACCPITPGVIIEDDATWISPFDPFNNYLN